MQYTPVASQMALQLILTAMELRQKDSLAGHRIIRNETNFAINANRYILSTYQNQSIAVDENTLSLVIKILSHIDGTAR